MENISDLILKGHFASIKKSLNENSEDESLLGRCHSMLVKLLPDLKESQKDEVSMLIDLLEQKNISSIGQMKKPMRKAGISELSPLSKKAK